MKRNALNPGTAAGAAVAFVVFLVLGAVPGLLYGGYTGLLVGNALLGATGEVTLALRVMTCGGMMVGFFAVLAVFLVAGGAAGTLVGGLARRGVGRGAVTSAV